MPVTEAPDAAKQPEGGGGPAGKTPERALGAATESGKGAYNTGGNATHGGEGKAELKQKRKDELPKSVVDRQG